MSALCAGPSQPTSPFLWEHGTSERFWIAAIDATDRLKDEFMLAVMLPRQAIGTEALTSSTAPANTKLAGAMVVRRNSALSAPAFDFREARAVGTAARRFCPGNDHVHSTCGGAHSLI